MMRILILLLLVVAVWWLLSGERRAAVRRRQKPSTPPPATSTRIEGERIVGCAQCDLHLPVSEARSGTALAASGEPLHWFCTDAHRRLYETRRPGDTGGTAPGP